MMAVRQIGWPTRLTELRESRRRKKHNAVLCDAERENVCVRMFVVSLFVVISFRM